MVRQDGKNLGDLSLIQAVECHREFSFIPKTFNVCDVPDIFKN